MCSSLFSLCAQNMLGGLEMEAELEVCCQPLLLKDGGELTTEQQDLLRVTYNVKCTTRPLRAGRAKEYPEQDTSEWRELTCHGNVDNIKAARQRALELCEETRRAKENETAGQRQQRLEAKNDKISHMISTKEAKREANIQAHKEGMMKEHQEALRRRAAETEAAYLEGLNAAWWASQAWQQQAQHDWPQG